MVSLLRGSPRRSVWSAARATTGRAVLILAILPLAGGQPLSAQSLKKRLDRTLDAAPLNRHFWGITVADSNGRVLYDRNADRLFVPASNTKLVVTAVAASLLPADFTVRTSVYATGPVTDGTVMGHLVLYGRGDPTMDERCYAVDTTLAGVCARDAMAPLRQLARDLRAAGVRTVAGPLVGDGSYFEPELWHPSWEQADLTWWYAAPVSGLGFSTNSVELTAAATALGAPATLTVAPWLGEISLDNRTRTVPEGMARTLDVIRVPGAEQLTVVGDVPVAERPATESVAVTDPNRYTVLAFRQALAEEGIAVLGGTTSTTDSLLYQEARRSTPLAEVESRPLRDWLFPILNTSQNWYAEMLLKQLGRQFGQAGSWREGLEVERRFLIDTVGIDSTQFSLSDGSGLSAVNLVTPAALVRLLTFMRHRPAFPIWSAGLPVSGERGSLRTRFLGGELEGKVMAKTGSISTVNTLSGYLTRQDGRTVIFSIQANHHALGGRAMIAAIDSIVGQLAR